MQRINISGSILTDESGPQTNRWKRYQIKPLVTICQAKAKYINCLTTNKAII